MLVYIARVSNKRGRPLFKSKAHPSREEAIAEAFAARPKARECSTSEGKCEVLNGVEYVFEYHRNIQYHSR